MNARRAIVLALVSALGQIIAQIKELERQIADAVHAHPDGEIFLSLFRTPQLVVRRDAAGRDRRLPRPLPNRRRARRRRRPSPVAIESGKRKVGAFRWGCDHRLRSAFGTLADTTRHWHPWAPTTTRARARGHDHPRAIRTLGRAWCRVIVALLARPHPIRPSPPRRTATPHHRHHPHPSSPRLDLAATQRMAGAAVTHRAARRAEREVLDGKPTPANSLTT